MSDDQALISANNVAAAPAGSEQTIPIWDGTELFYRVWLRAPGSGKAVLLFHRGHEHSGRLVHVAEALDLPEVNVFAWDARGHGRSPGRRGFAPDFAGMVRDMDSFVRAVGQRHGIALEEMAVVAHSVGAVVAAAWVHDYAPPVRALVLVTPAFRVKLYAPLAIPTLRIVNHFKPDAVIKSYVKPKMLTHDPAMAASYQSDALISRDISNRILIGMYDAAQRVVADAAAIHVPTLVLSAGSDWVVRQHEQRRFYERLSSQQKRFIEYPGMYHAILHEQARAKPLADIRQFVEAAFAGSALAAGKARAELAVSGDPATRRRYEQLTRPRSFFCPLRWSYAVSRLFLQSVGRLSHGISIGWRHGFDSGQSLDHVYLNRARGVTPLGKLIDRVYLDGVGWKGIRLRKVHMEKRLRWCIEQLRCRSQEVRLLDIAAGPGRYVLDVIAALPEVPIAAVLRDRDENGLAAGRVLAEQMGITTVRFETGDAFDGQALAAIQPRPSIAVVSGLYELFPQNEMIARSLAGLYQAMQPGGYLLYTNQPWHPQLELIARVLTNRDGEPWIMRCRSQLEMDQLVKQAGFQKLDMDIDPFGIFTVSVACKP